MKQKILQGYLVPSNQIVNGQLVVIQNEEVKQIINIQKILAHKADTMSIQMLLDIRRLLLSILLILERLGRMLIPDKLKLELILELMILKMIGIRKLLTLQQMIIIFIMSIKLEEKLLLNRAKKYAAKLKGIGSFSISLLRENDFIWHRKKLIKIHKIDNEIKRKTYSHPIDILDLYRSAIAPLNILNQVHCYLFYEGSVCIFIQCTDFYSLLDSIFKLEHTYDLSLSFTSPDRILAINDSEYELEVYYVIR